MRAVWPTHRIAPHPVGAHAVRVVWWDNGDVVRILMPSEQRFVRHATYTGRSVRVCGGLDTAALDAAFAALTRAYPVLVCRIGEDADGNGHLLRPSGEPVRTWVAPGDPGSVRIPGAAIDPRDRLAYLDVTPAVAGIARVTLFVHHAVADAGHCVELFTRLWSYYTDYVETGDVSVVPHDYPRSLEWYAAECGVARGPLSGLERVHRPLEANERIVPPDPPHPVPPALAHPARTVLDVETTSRVVDLGRTSGIGVNGLVTAALLRAWAAERAPGEPLRVNCVYPVDLRARSTPPVAAAAGTNMAGLTGFSARIDPATGFAELGARVAEHLRDDLASGLIAQSVLHFPDYFGPRRVYSLAGHIAITNTGRVPIFRSPDGLELSDYEIVYLSAHPRPSAGASAAVTFLVYTSADRLTVGVLGGGEAGARLPDAVAKQLHTLAAESVGDRRTTKGN
ncbi:phthiocerol/phthiodiolone dimycocerosyl transferase family protein [Nocardia arizonensis]|uniref:phthiocerol/phthiodiolone dimycocerosyl transferase family protein n=1 Tax=Nocardia arizonensis TaxID=1141647 RepID=UPI0009ECA2A1|nr:acyltransferase [Nocardia arizonensis]